MCGIAGVVSGARPVDLERLRGMSERMRHRGPDDEGIVLIDPAGAMLTLAGPDTPPDVLTSAFPYAPGRRRGSPSDARFRVGLLNRRLAIVDLSAAGHGPMCDAA